MIIDSPGTNFNCFFVTLYKFLQIEMNKEWKKLTRKERDGDLEREREREREEMGPRGEREYSFIQQKFSTFTTSRLHKFVAILYKWLPSHPIHHRTDVPGPTDFSGPLTRPDRWPDSDFRWPFSEFASDCFLDSCCGSDDSVFHTNCHHDETIW